METTDQKQSRILLIDADSFKYIFSWWHRDKNNIEDLKKDVLSRVRGLCSEAGVNHFQGVFGTSPLFRVEAYKYKPYKGNRPPKEDFVVRWEPIIEEYCCNELGFIKVQDMEADDYIAYMMRLHPETFICSSRDKDLKQIPGLHLQFKEQKVTDTEDMLFLATLDNVTELAAAQTFWLQMLTGDATDNVAGIPGMGDKKALAYLKDEGADMASVWEDPMEMGLKVHEKYVSYFGPHYGPIIYNETFYALRMGPELIGTMLQDQNLYEVRCKELILEDSMGDMPAHIPFDFEA